MKTLTLFFFIVCTTLLSANAQITKGNWMVGGDANFNIDKTESTNSSGFSNSSKFFNFRITPAIGYFIEDKFALGLSPFLAFTNPEGSNNNNISYGVGPFARFYFLKAENKINLFAQTSYFFAQTDHPSVTSKSSSFEFKTGAVMFFNSSVGLELTLNYINNKIKNSSEATSNRLSFNVGFQIHLEK